LLVHTRPPWVARLKRPLPGCSTVCPYCHSPAHSQTCCNHTGPWQGPSLSAPRPPPILACRSGRGSRSTASSSGSSSSSSSSRTPTLSMTLRPRTANPSANGRCESHWFYLGCMLAAPAA